MATDTRRPNTSPDRSSTMLTPGLETSNGVADIAGNYPSKGVGERGAWFRDSKGSLLSLGQPVRRSRS
jgi:hypothetical protein